MSNVKAARKLIEAAKKLAGGINVNDVKMFREDLTSTAEMLKSIDEYMFEGMSPNGASKALGVLASVERSIGNLRTKLEKMSKDAVRKR